MAAGRLTGRLAGLARVASEGRGDVRAAESWGRLLGACSSMGEAAEQQAEGGERAAPPRAGDGDGSVAAKRFADRLLGACSSMGEDEQQAEGGHGAVPPRAGDADGSVAAGPAGAAGRGLEAFAAALVPPCDVGREVLPVCSNPLYIKLLTASEAFTRLYPCRGKCGGTACGGAGPCCCHWCAKSAAWRACM